MKKIRTLLKRKKLKQKEVADKIGISKQLMTLWLNKPNLERFKKICEAIDEDWKESYQDYVK